MNNITFFPPVFDGLGDDADVTTLSLPTKMSVYWHGTTEDKVEAILREGLKNINPKTPWVCLTTKAHVAHFWGRLNTQYTPHKSVLIRIPGAVLNETLFGLERGYINLCPYGAERKERQNLVQTVKKQNWQDDRWGEFQASFDVVAYKGIIPVEESWLDFRSRDFDTRHPDALNQLNLFDEFDTGVPTFTNRQKIAA